MNIVIRVDAEIGEESTWVSEIKSEEFDEIVPLLLEIKKNDGYFPTGKFRKDDDPKPEILYSGYSGWKNLISRLPTPSSGIKRISEIHIYKENPISLYI